MTEQDHAEREKRAREKVQRARKGTTRSVSKDGSRRYFRSHLEVREIERLVEFARQGNADAMEILRNHARGAREAGVIVPAALHEFVWEWFIDGPPKKRSGPKPEETLLRNMIIVSLVKIASEEGLDETRSKDRHDTTDGPLSACAIVAQEFGLGESNVEEIWRGGKANVGR